jgi:hypothetical protein
VPSRHDAMCLCNNVTSRTAPAYSLQNFANPCCPLAVYITEHQPCSGRFCPATMQKQQNTIGTVSGGCCLHAPAQMCCTVQYRAACILEACFE